MDRLSVDRIRRATFPVTRRGYSKRAVHRFLDRVAHWLETGTGDPARADLLRLELARVGQRTAAILLEAHAEAQRLRAEAEREAAQIVRRAREEADLIRGGRDLPRAQSVRQAAARRRPSVAVNAAAARGGPRATSDERDAAS
jgi:DivIVA domain-containing protein